MATISAALIVKDEAKVLKRCLDSLKGFDQIVVVDTGSQDDTHAIALAAATRVFSCDWCDDFSAARNKVLEHCTGDWVLSIDADEYLPKGEVKKIKKAVAKAKGNTISIRIKQGATEEFWYPRLFRKGGHFEGRLHELLISAGEGCDQSDITIIHAQDPDHRRDPEKNIAILLEEARLGKPRETYYLAREYWYKGDYITAAWWFQRYLEVGGWKAERCDAYLYLARCLWALGRGDEARQSCLRAIEGNPDFKEAFLFMAEMSYEREAALWRGIAETRQSTDVLFRRA